MNSTEKAQMGEQGTEQKQFSLEGQNNSNSNSQIIERKPIEGTPFQVLREEERHYLTWGAYKLTEACKSEEDAIDRLTYDQWLVIARMVFAMMHARELAEGREPLFAGVNKVPPSTEEEKERLKPIMGQTNAEKNFTKFHNTTEEQ